MDSIEHNSLPSRRLVCPFVRIGNISSMIFSWFRGCKYFKVDNSYYAKDDDDSHKLFGCNNNERDETCGACRHDTMGTSCYFCSECNKWYHKECVESPPILKSPYHPKHTLQLYRSYNDWLISLECHSCSSPTTRSIYHCSICNFSLDPVCAGIPPLINHQKRHEHPLFVFPRKSDLICDICGLVDNTIFIFVCLLCDFLVHKTCIYLPHVVKISRHKHRLSFVYSLPSREWSCPICRKKIDENYGAYTCMAKECIYGVHSKCGTNLTFWDGKELEGEPEEVNEIIEPSFEVISDGIILHFSHSEHHMRLDEDNKILYDGKKLCQACMLPQNDGKTYTCMECDYLLHETCAYLPRVIQHVLHPHPLSLDRTQFDSFCDLCGRNYCFGFSYVCSNGCDNVMLDARCASIPEKHVHPSHRHPLFITISKDDDKCSICDRCKMMTLNCDECRFVLCFVCATLPNKVRYKNDEHLLTLSYEEEDANGICWCDLCEETMIPRIGFYRSNEYEVIVHNKCLVREDLYMSHHSSSIIIYGRRFKIVQNDGFTRPICNHCRRRCQFKTMLIGPFGDTYCSTGHMINFLKY